MSTRFHDKWHGANHNSVSAIGIPDAGRDPIASYIFPFEGEFIMNNSPRNNGGDGHSEYSSGNIFDRWILSSNRIDTNIVRSQQDESGGNIILSAKHEDGNQVVQSLHGTDNIYELEVSGADNGETFDCSYNDGTGEYRHETHKKVGTSGGSSYTEDVDANVPKIVELIDKKATGESRRKVIRTVKDSDRQYSEIRVTDENGHCPISDEGEPFETVDCAAIDGANHVAFLDVGNVRADVNTDGNVSLVGYDTKNKHKYRNRISVSPEIEGGVLVVHDCGSDDPVYVDIQGTDIHVKTGIRGTLDRKSMFSTENVSQDKRTTVDHDFTTTVGKPGVGGNCYAISYNDKYDRVYNHFDQTTNSSTISAVAYHETLVDGTLLSQSSGNSTYRSANANIYVETPSGQGIYLNHGTSVFPHTLRKTAVPGTEVSTDRMVVSAYDSANPAYDYKAMPEDNGNIYFENMCGRIPHLNTDKIHCNYAWFDKFEATSGIVHFIDIVQSDVSGFDILGKRTGLDVLQTMPTDSRLHLASASLWNDTWMYTGGDALFNRNVQINKTETVKRKVSNETSLEVGKKIGSNTGDKIGPGSKYSLLVHGHSCLDGNADISGSETVVGNSTTRGNASVFGDMEIGFHKAAGSSETALKVKGDERIDGSIFATGEISANDNLTINGCAKIILEAEIGGDTKIDGSAEIGQNTAIHGNLDIDGYVHVGPAASVSASTLSANNTFIDWGRINKITSRGAPFITVDSSVRFQQPASGTHFTAISMSADELATFGGTKFGAALENAGNDDCVQVGDNTSVLNSTDSVLVGTHGTKLKNASNCIAIGSVGMGTEVAQSNTIVVGSGSTEESNLLQFHNVPFFVFDEGLSSGKLKDTVYSFYDYENHVFHLPFTSSVTVTTQEVSATEAFLGRTTVHDGIRVIGSNGLFVEGNAYVASAVSASEFYIVRKNGDGDVIEVVPLSTEIENAVEELVGRSRGFEPSVYSPEAYAEDSENAGIVALAEQVDEAEHASYVFSAERIEHFRPEKADLVENVDVVSNASVAKHVLRVASADRVGMIAHVDTFESGDVVRNANIVEWCASANKTDTVVQAGAVSATPVVERADKVDNCIEVYDANVVGKSELVQDVASVNKAKVVESATDVKSIRLYNGMELRGPAVRRVVNCDVDIPVTEWVDYYRTTSTDVVLSGDAIGWNEEDCDLSFTLRFVPDVDTLYGISISADRDINWIGTNGFTKKFKAPVSVKIRVSKDEITARLEA